MAEAGRQAGRVARKERGRMDDGREREGEGEGWRWRDGGGMEGGREGGREVGR